MEPAEKSAPFFMYKFKLYLLSADNYYDIINIKIKDNTTKREVI